MNGRRVCSLGRGRLRVHVVLKKCHRSTRSRSRSCWSRRVVEEYENKG